MPAPEDCILGAGFLPVKGRGLA